MVGLPGSGKTTIAKKVAKQRNVTYIDCDKMCLDNGMTLDEMIKHISKSDYENGFILDGLFLSEKIQKKIDDAFDVYFLFIEPNRDFCLYNDKKRNREKSSRGAILHSKIHEPRYNVEVIEALKFDDIQYLIHCNNWSQSYESETWTKEGSTYGTCWDENGPSEASPTEPPNLEEVYGVSDIFKKFHIDIKTVDNYSSVFYEGDYYESDYYGGIMYYGYFKYNTRNLIEALAQKKYGTSENLSKIAPELFI
jgi:hypothetical protein